VKNCGLYILLTFSCTNTWFYNPWGQPYPHEPISLTSWTVNTLFFFYLTFPLLLKLLKPLSDKAISRLIVLLFWFQSIPFFLVWVACSKDYRLYRVFYNLITMGPIPRLPVFTIGVLGGLQTLRWRESLDYQDPVNSTQEKKSSASWKRRADIGGFIYVVFFIVCISIEIFHEEKSSWTSFSRWSSGYSQLFLVHLQLTIILGLSRSGNTSNLAKICNNFVAQFLGDISMVLYLIHYDLLGYVSMLTSILSEEDEYTLKNKIFTTPQVLFGTAAFSILLSWILLKTFVNPLGKGIKNILHT